MLNEMKSMILSVAMMIIKKQSKPPCITPLVIVAEFANNSLM